MKIGIPRALLFYYYIPFWKKFFEELGMEVVISDETNKKIMNMGIKESVAELCVPIKVFVGHSLNLLEKQVDFIFIPRMASIHKGEFFCPKFMGLPDMLRHGVDGLADKIISCKISSDTEDISDYKHYLPLKHSLNISKKQMKAAAKKAKEEWVAFRMYSKMGYTISEALSILENQQTPRLIENKGKGIRIGLVGYVYNIYDKYISMDIVNKLRELNVQFETFEMVDGEKLEEQLIGLNKRLFWTFSNKLLGAGYSFFNNKQIDGVIHLTAFGCGPDSFLGKLLEIKSEETGIPFMSIRVDEHTGENHVQTRIEAFIDMLSRKVNVG